MKRLRILTLISLLLAIGVFLFKEKRTRTTIRVGEGLVVNKGWLIENKNRVTPDADSRPADQTFLTFPEWYLVFSPQEQADYFTTKTATSFPYMTHVHQFWDSYNIVSDQIRDNFPYNGGYHFMIWIIGGSTTAEYACKSIYETTVGRITDTESNITDEDKFYGLYTQQYVAFIKDRPWYEFDFSTLLSTLWTETSFFGPNYLRKMERKYFITSELIAKALYGQLIKLGTKATYDEALPNTVALIDSLPKDCPMAKPIKEFPDGSALISLPRYDKFNGAATALANCGVRFKEVAGNTSAVLLTVLVPSEWTCSIQETQVVFTQPIVTKPNLKRVAIATLVGDLHAVLKELNQEKVRVEHIFDY